MFISKVTLLLVFCISTAMATNHTMCYKYFMEKDKCVISAADDRIRCPAHNTKGKMFEHSPEKPKRKPCSKKSRTLQRRYETTQNVGFSSSIF
ncbi:hypothetical protein O181_049808 [Austropuccinia psidii MF-1]|uniref:Secreted protein n=1 Tax=Austropuccinia psidii MF-1 TaxID=1389203 RepID=A0A9Q3DY75_9BASI|nr:hypothetical protein [Austropuccinia psidii MF-1]